MVPEISDGTGRCVVGALCFFLCVIAICVELRFIGFWVIVMVPVVIGLPAYCDHKISGSLPAAVIHRSLMLLRRRLPVAFKKPHHRTSAASGVGAGSLVHLDKDYQRLRVDHRARHGRSAELPKVPYRLVLAAYRVNGNERRFAFSDGTSAAWHPASKVLHRRLKESWWRPGRDPEAGAAAALCELIEFLYAEEQGKSVRVIHERLGDHRETDVDRALDAAKWWRMVSKDGRFAFQITDAGSHWHRASREFQAAHAAERKKMSNGAPRINIHNSGVVNYAGNDISGDQTYTLHHNGIPDPRLLASLREVLASPEIPWADSELVSVRRVMEDAVERDDPHASGLKQAIVKLKEICGEIAVGVAGNGAYQLLLQHFL